MFRGGSTAEKQLLSAIFDADIENKLSGRINKAEDKKFNQGDVLLWGRLADHINKSNEKILFGDKSYIYVDFEKLSRIEREQFTAVKAMLEKNYHGFQRMQIWNLH